jgi:drug/metabolite transporter (DMT)-like permease
MLGLMVTLWSVNFIVGKVALRHMDVWTLVSFRLVLAALVLIPIYLAWPRRQRFGPRDYWNFAYLGFFGVAVNQGCFTVGLNYTTVGHASIIVSTGPVLVLLFARVLKLEALTPAKVIGVATSFAGVFVLVAENGLGLHSGTLAGDLISFTGATSYAIYAVLGKKVAKQYDSLSMNTFNCIVAAIIFAPLAVRQGLRLDWGSVGWAGWAGLFYMAAASSVAAYLIFFWALRHLAASRLAAVSYVQPVLVTLLGIILLGERLTHSLLVGGGLVLLGVYLAERGPREDNGPQGVR